MRLFGRFIQLTVILLLGLVSLGANPVTPSDTVLTHQAGWYRQFPSFALTSISCPAADFCVAVGFDNMSVVVWDGNEWRLNQLLPEMLDISFLEVECPTTSYCVLVSSLNVIHWHIPTNEISLGNVELLSDVSCLSATYCVGVKGQELVVWNGTAWINHPSGTAGGLNRVDCVSLSFCMAAGDFETVVWNGVSSTVYPIGDSIGAVSCTSPTHCMAVGLNTIFQWDGTGWAEPLGLLETKQVERRPSSPLWYAAVMIDCVSETYCVLGLDFDSWIWDGTTFTDFYTANQELYDVDCLAEDNCLVVGEYNTLVIKNATGWEEQNLETYQHRYLYAISCTSLNHCLTVGHNGSAVWDGTEWTTLALTLGKTLYGISCVTPSFCLGVGIDGSLRWDGSNWVTTAGYQPTSDVSCVSSTFCVGVGGSQVGFWNGLNWVGQPAPSPSLTSVECASTTFCIANGTYIWNGSSWSNAGLGLGDVSCVSASYCVGIIGSNLRVWNGSSWNTIATPFTMGTIQCSDVSSCWIFSYIDTVTIIRHWNGVTFDDRGQIQDMSAINCPTSDNCMFTESNGKIGGIIPVTWQDVEILEGSVGLELVTLGCLQSLTITAINSPHPQATPNMLPFYWTMTPNSGCTDDYYFELQVDMWEPPGLAPAEAPTKFCGFTGSGWDCDASDLGGGQIVRLNATPHQAWTIGDNVSPTAVSLNQWKSLASPNQWWLWVGLTAGLLLLTAGVIRKRR